MSRQEIQDVNEFLHELLLSLFFFFFGCLRDHESRPVNLARP